MLYLICSFKFAYAQRAYDGECVIGLNGRILCFNDSDIPKIKNPNISSFGFKTGSSSIADLQGKLTMACGGYAIYNGQGDTMLNGLRLNYPKLRFYDQGSSNWTQNSIILPIGKAEYYVFTTTMSDQRFDEWSASSANFRFDMLTAHKVDMAANNGLGKVVERNKVLMDNAVLSHNRMTAVKHGNGRDWWLVKPHQTKAIFYLFLVSSDGIEGPFEKTVNLPDIGFQSGIVGQSTFNRLGDKYAYTTWSMGGVQVLNFDRCTGDFTPYYFFTIPTEDTTLTYDFSSGTCFSPDDKILYANTSNAIYQIDWSDTNTPSPVFIHGRDVPSDSLQYFPRYVNINLGADNRLYLNNRNGIRNEISYIDKPNERGLACDFKARGLYVGNGNAIGLPNMPYYHLGKKEGSLCDTVGRLYTDNLKLYPNPVSNNLNVYLPLDYNSEVKTTLYTISGQRLMDLRTKLNYRQEYSIDMSDLARGIYFLRIESGGQIWKDKVVKE